MVAGTAATAVCKKNVDLEIGCGIAFPTSSQSSSAVVLTLLSLIGKELPALGPAPIEEDSPRLLLEADDFLPFLVAEAVALASSLPLSLPLVSLSSPLCLLLL